MKKGASKKLTAKQRAEISALARLPERRIDTSDAAEVRDWSGARRGLFYRPIKRQLTLRLDANVIEWFREHAPNGEGYQTDINRVLSDYVAAREKEKA